MDLQIPNIYDLSRFNMKSKPLIEIKFKSLDDNILLLLVNDIIFKYECIIIDKKEYSEDIYYNDNNTYYNKCDFLIHLNNIFDTFIQNTNCFDITFKCSLSGTFIKILAHNSYATTFSENSPARFIYNPQTVYKLCIPTYELTLQSKLSIFEYNSLNKNMPNFHRKKIHSYQGNLGFLFLKSGMFSYFLYYIDIIKCDFNKIDKFLINDNIIKETHIKDFTIKTDNYNILFKLMKRDKFYRIYLYKMLNKKNNMIFLINNFKENKHISYNIYLNRNYYNTVDDNRNKDDIISLPYDIYNGADIIYNYICPFEYVD